MNNAWSQGRRLLIVEDEILIAMLLEEYLLDMGFAPGWHADTVARALQLATEEAAIDGAILDLNLHGVKIDPVADALLARNIPFCFVTGGNSSMTGFPDTPVLQKPFTAADLGGVIERLVLGVR